jgi:hypothetical protein
MSNDYKVSLVAAQENFNTTVLRIVSAAKNSITQFYTEKVLIDAKAIESLNRKIILTILIFQHQFNSKIIGQPTLIQSIKFAKLISITIH